jgi:hypothetical protein
MHYAQRKCEMHTEFESENADLGLGGWDEKTVQREKGRDGLNWVNILKPKLVYIIFKNSVRTAKKTQHFTITKVNWLMMFKEIIAVCSENHTKPTNTNCKSYWLL